MPTTIMESRKSTKIVATIGPKTESEEMLTRLIQAGMNVMRLNMSHGDHAEHALRIKNGRAAASKLNAPIAILLDLSGPKIRTGIYETERIMIEEGSKLTLTTEEVIGTPARIYVNYRKLPQEVKAGSVIMLDDGKKKLIVDSVEGTEVHCTVAVGGELKARRGVNIPGAYLSIDTITAKDREDLAFGIEQGVDLIALSFVRKPEDISELRGILATLGAPNLPIIAKIETQEAIENLDAVLAEADGCMVARGDLAIEIPAEEVPRWQKEMIRKSNALGKPVITATQLLESMITSPVPTRAEVSDVANAIYDGTDAVMLSEESTLGQYPVEAVQMLARVARASEGSAIASATKTIPDSVTSAVARAAEELNARAIVALTESGTTARTTARFHPHCPIIALTPSEATRKALALTRGVHPFLVPQFGSLEETLTYIPDFLIKNEFAQKGDTVIVTAGLRFGVTGATNLLVAITI
ncbi:MAG: pyk [Parcubacteria group bacterium]|nr:pyk [Parcubacteria group bacterium]